MPTPKPGEMHEDWMDRCMSDKEHRDTFPDQEQAAAVCESKWREHEKEKGMSIQWLRASIKGRPEAIDRQAAIIRGYVVAQEGPFKSEGRGEFNTASLRRIIQLGNDMPNGLKSRLGHPTMSDDGIGKFLGRGRDLRMSEARDARTGKKVQAVRGDLHFDPTAHDTPHGNLAKYVMDLTESDPDALSSSLVLEVDELPQLGKNGKPERDNDGNEKPPIWMPKRLHGSDIVDTGDAVDSLLSPEEFAHALSVGLTPELSKLIRFDNVARLSTQLLDGMFRDRPRAEIEERCHKWLTRYLELRFGEPEEVATPNLDARRERLKKARRALEDAA